MRQYIGARYVPTFADPLTWDNSHSYEALMMVDYMGDTYTSKKPVPPGIDITDTRYWIMTGSFNSQLNELRQEIEELTRPRRILYFGDSYNTIVPGVAWTDIIDNIMGFTDSYPITRGGSGFIGTYHWLDQIQNEDVGDDSTITDIIIIGGANDSFGTLSDLPDAMENFDYYVKLRFENLKRIYIGFVGNSFYTDGQSKNMRKARAGYVETAKKLGWIYLNNIETTLYKPQLIQEIAPNDYIHPTSDGVKEIGYNAVAALNSGKCEVSYPIWAVEMTVDTGAFVTKTFNINESITDNILTISTQDVTIQTSTSATGFIKLAACNALQNAILPNVFIPVVVKYNGADYRTTLTFSNSKDLYISMPVTVPANEYINLRSISMTFDLSITS